MSLDLTSLHKAAASLEEILRTYDSTFESPLATPELMRGLKAGIIQNFEFTYELSWKFMKRWLEINVSPATSNVFTRRELFRYAAEAGLIDDVAKWFKYNEARNIIFHTYDEEKADKILENAVAFKDDVNALYNVLNA